MAETLTGDEDMDKMIPLVMDLVAATREMDGDKFGELVGAAHKRLRDEFGHADHMVGWFMFAIAAALIPYDKSPEQLLRWHEITEQRMDKLLAAGFDRTSAAYVIDEQARGEGEG